jgi:hypothetical protein
VTVTRTVTFPRVPTPTPTKTAAKTLTPTATVSVQVRGSIYYYGTGLPVAGAQIGLYTTDADTKPVMVSTDLSGQYAFTNVSTGTYQIQPQPETRKQLDIAGTSTPLDAVRVLKVAANMRTLMPGQRFACDVTGDGAIDASDAARILEYHVGLTAALPVWQRCNSAWIFVPQVLNPQVTQPEVTDSTCQNGAIAFRPLVIDANYQDFAAVVVGDCTDKWQPPSEARVSSTTEPSAVQLGPYHRRGRSVRVVVSVVNPSTFDAADVQVQYDPAQLTARGVRPLASARQALVAVNAEVPGVVRVALASAQQMQAGRMLVLRFMAKAGHHEAPTMSIVQAALSRE